MTSKPFAQTTNHLAATNSPLSFEELGDKYFYGKGVPRDFRKAFEFFHQAAVMGSSRGQSWVGYLYQTGQGVETDYGEAVRWTRMAAEQGRAFDANRLAGYFWEGLGTPINREEALRWLKTAAEKGDVNSSKQVPVWMAIWEAEKKQNLKNDSETKKKADLKPQPECWRVAGPWKMPKGDAREWFRQLPLEEVCEGFATGTKAIFFGEKRDVLEVEAVETANLAKSLGTYAGHIALVQGRWTAETAGKTILAVGSDDAIKVWVNEKLVVNDWLGRKVTGYEDLYPIEVKKGENKIHALLVNFRGPWGFFLTVPDAKTKERLLSKSITEGDYERTKLLLEAGASPRQPIAYRLPGLELAQIMKRTHLEGLLRGYGAKESLLAWSHYPFLVRILGPWFLNRDKNAPGFGLLLARNGKVVFEHYAGLANVENKVAIGPHTKFAIGSVSKQFVAAAIFRMQEEGKIKLSDPISRYLPDFPHGETISLRQLLTHTSGICEYTTGQDFYNRCGDAPGPGEIYQRILAAPYGDQAGRRFSYSNSNYYLAGIILEKITGQSLREILKNLFFDPLGMKDTELAQGDATIENYATPYRIKEGRPERANTWNMDWAAGAGGVVSTPRDLFAWSEALWGGKVLRAESLKEIWRPELTDYSNGTSEPEGYACGWGVIQNLAKTWVGHGGYIPPYRAALYRIPELNITTISLSNAGEDFGMSPESLSYGAACLFFGNELGSSVRDIPAASLSEAEIEKRTGLYDDGVGVIEIQHENGRWYWQGQGFRERIRLSGDRHFVGQESQKTFSTVDSENGRINGLKIREAYFPIFLKKLPPRKDSEEFVRSKMAEYTGRYSFGPYGDYEVIQEDGRLYGKLAQQQKIPFNVLNRDDFEVEGVGARFSVIRDHSGKITRADFRQHGKLIEAPKIK